MKALLMFRSHCHSTANPPQLRRACLALLLLLTALPVTVQAQFTTTSSNGALTVVDYTGSDPVVIVPAMIEGLPVTSIGDHAFGGYANITSVIIPEGVLSIGAAAMYYCTSLASVTLPASLTDIGDNVFEGDTALTTLMMPSGVTSLGNDDFIYCSGLLEISVDPVNPNYSSLDGVVFDKKQTTLLAYPPGRMEPSYDIPSTVTSIANDAFFYCLTLTSVVIPSSVNSIGNYAFNGCEKLASVSIPASVTDIGTDAFWDCRNLPAISVDALNPNYSSLDGVLFNKDQTTLMASPAGRVGSSYTVPAGVTSIAQDAFFFSTLSEITLSGSLATIGGGAFSGCDRLAAINVPTANQFFSSENGVLFNKDKTTLLQFSVNNPDHEYVIPPSVATIGNFAFYVCTNLVSLSIPDGVGNINLRAINGCTSLASLSIPNSVTNFGDFALAGAHWPATIKSDR